MHPFEQLMYDRFAQSISTWDTERHSDIYAISFLYDTYWSTDAEGQEIIIQGQVSLSYTTLSHYEAQVAKASNAQEAKWSTAYWPLDFTAQIPRTFSYGGQPPDDDLFLRDQWCAFLGIPPVKTDGGGRPEYDEVTLYKAINAVCQSVAKALHQNGILSEKIGKSVPIIIEEHDNNQASVEATRAANPPGLSREAEKWLLGRTYSQLDNYKDLLKEISFRPPPEQALVWRDAFLVLQL